MFVGTHKTIAENIYSLLIVEKNIRLNHNLFVYGNIVPDFKIDFIGERHYKSFCYEKVKANIIEMSNKQMTLAEFSYRSGVICHYISDMFCYPHEQEWRYGHGNTKEHIMFEDKQYAFMKNKIFVPGSRIMIDDFTNECIDLFIETLLAEYQNAVDYSRDMFFSVTACYNYIESLLFNYFKKNIVFA